MMSTNSAITYLENIIAFSIFNVLRFFYRRNTNHNGSILFINLGKIGDLTISSILFENLKVFTVQSNIYFLIRKEYSDLFRYRNTRIKIITWDYNKYKWLLPYRLYFLYKLKHLRIEKTYDLNYYHRIIFDEVSILSCAKEIICLNKVTSNNETLFRNSMQKYFDKIISNEPMNQFDKHVLLLCRLSKGAILADTSTIIPQNIQAQSINKALANVPMYDQKQKIAIAPISSKAIKNWGLINYKELISKIINNLDVIILLLGTKEQSKILSSIANIDCSKIFNLGGLYTISEASLVIKLSQLFIGNDSGFTHISKSLKVPTIGIIGGGSFGNFFPYNTSNKERLLYYSMDCFGCEWKCTKDKPFCVQNVKVDEVYNDVITLMSIK